jgi:imidazoleglycerol phosphate synthase glutamine amidotransferase subunit HisH
LINKGWIDALRSHILQDKPFFGICIGMQSLFEGSDESPVEHGLAIIPGRITKFSTENSVRVPQIGWNGIRQIRPSIVLENIETSSMVRFTSVHAQNHS